MSASLRALLLDDIATELHGRCAFDELLLLDGSSHPRVRALQIDAAARRRDWDVVERATHDEDHGPRAIAARWLVRRGCADAAGFLSDTDPTVREAALSGIVAEHGAAPLAAAMAALDDRDPSVRRMATRAFVLASRSFAAPSTTAKAPDIDTIVRAAAACFAATDPFLRRIACELPLDDDRVLAHVIERTGDDDAGVRSAAAGALDRRPDLDPRVRALAESTSLAPGTRTLAYSWLLRRLDDDALALARAAYDRETDSDVRTLLLGIASAISAGRDEPSATPDVDHEREAADRAPAPHIEPAPFVEARDPGSAHVDAVERRPFGRAGFDVAPLAISGAFDLPREGLELAADAGVDLYFWEPGYDLLGRFLRGRDRLRVITGTYHADAASIRADVERALRTLRREALDAFLLFWTRSPARVDDAAYRVLDQLKREGKLRAIGFSTHFRELARDAIAERPWDVVMIRHSAAHPGVETELLPAARAAQTAIVTFSALTYGRMTSGAGAPTPAECYRYSLAQPGVTACISAPRRIDELAHNLGALAEPRMTEDRIAELRAFGLGVRAESARVNTLLRQPTRDAAAAAREMLASEPAPSSTELRVPAASAARRSRARLGGRRRR